MTAAALRGTIATVQPKFETENVVKAGRRQAAVEERRQQILEGALQVFSRKGFVLATNRDIAEAAGIASPGLIYHYFKDKEDLLQAVMERFAPPMQILSQADELYRLPPVEALTRIGRLYLGLLDNSFGAAALRVMIGQMLREEEFAHTLAKIGPLRLLYFVADYLSSQMDKGEMRRCDPHIAARCFVGPLMLQVLGAAILRIPEIAEVSEEALLTQCVETFLQGMTTQKAQEKEKPGT